MKKIRILLLSGYDAASHRCWRKSLENGLGEFEWTQIALPDRYFFWRIRGNALTFAYEYKEQLSKNYQCIIATSMVDLVNLRGFVPEISNIPTILYFHENQFVYPLINSLNNQDSKNIVNAQLTTIYSALCADKILFNSEYNKRTFFSGAKALFNKLPDCIPKGILNSAEEKSSVLPVPIAGHLFNTKGLTKQKNQANVSELTEALLAKQPQEKMIPKIIWNHRWEYDKQPEVFFAALRMLRTKNIDFRLHLLGQSFRKQPQCFDIAKEEFKDQILTWGYQPRNLYEAILRESDLVVSTASHDFQGLSMIEAIACGCLPVAPNRVAYPEYIDKRFLYDVPMNDGVKLDNNIEAKSLAAKLVEVFERKVQLLKLKSGTHKTGIANKLSLSDSQLSDCPNQEILSGTVSNFSEEKLISRYAAAIREVASVEQHKTRKCQNELNDEE